MASRRVKGPTWPSWRYGPRGEAEIFNSERDVPFGWTKKPGEEFVPPTVKEPLDRQQLISDLEAKGVTVLGWWAAAYMKDLLK